MKFVLQFISWLQCREHRMTYTEESQNPVGSTARLRGWLPALLISLLISLVIISPSFRLGTATGQDFLFHASSWLDAAGQWKAGILYPRWTEWANYGFGEPRFIFYPPGSWMLGAALGLLLPWNSVPAVYIVLVQAFAGMSAFFLARRIFPRQAALFSAACYAANPYALLIIYLRSDFAELLANAVVPLVFLAALEVCGLMDGPDRGRGPSAGRAVTCFAAALAAVWLANAPEGVIACYSSAAVFGFAALTRKSWQPVLRGAAGIALGLGLAGFYLLPAAYEQRWVNISEALSPGLLPSENFLFTIINDPEHTLFNWIASGIAVLLIVLAGLAAVAVHRTRREDQEAFANRAWQALLFLAGLATLLMLHLSNIFWELLPKLRFVQFPWRWMGVLAVPFAVFLGGAMARRRWGWVWAVATFAVLGATGAALVHQGWWTKNDIPILRQEIARGEGFEGTFEYDPKGDDHTNIPVAKAPKVQVMDTDSTPGPNTPPVVSVERWSPEYKEVIANTREPFALGLRLLNYPAWQVRVNGAVVNPLDGEDFHQMLVPLQPGESHIQVRFRRTWDRWAGGIISLISCLVAFGVLRRRMSS